MNNARIMLLPEWMGRKQWAMVRARRRTSQVPRSKRWLRALSSRCEGPSAIFCASPASKECGYQGREVREIFSQNMNNTSCFQEKHLKGVKEETDRTGSFLKAGLHLGPVCGLWALCPGSMEMTYQQEKQATWMEEPQGSYLDSLLPKRIPSLFV